MQLLSHNNVYYVSYLISLLWFVGGTNAAFVTSNLRLATSRSLSKTTIKSGKLHVTIPIQDVTDFYTSYPLESAVITCGIEASLADATAQVQSWNSDGNNKKQIELDRTATQLLYGILIGVLAHVEYDHLFPFCFGTSKEISTVLSEVSLDMFILCPLFWLPPAYMIKAFLTSGSIFGGIQNYINDIRNEGLLIKYWTVWIPAECCLFGVIPDQFRVAFMAFVSFIWLFILSSLSFKGEEQNETVEPDDYYLLTAMNGEELLTHNSFQAEWDFQNRYWHTVPFHPKTTKNDKRRRIRMSFQACNDRATL